MKLCLLLLTLCTMKDGHRHFQPLAAAHFVATSFDYATTARWQYEKNPAFRPFAGTPPRFRRMIVFGGLENIAPEILPKRFRKWTRISLISTHIVAGGYNLR
jgi:hypothetical protein